MYHARARLMQPIWATLLAWKFVTLAAIVLFRWATWLLLAAASCWWEWKHLIPHGWVLGKKASNSAVLQEIPGHGFYSTLSKESLVCRRKKTLHVLIKQKTVDLILGFLEFVFNSEKNQLTFFSGNKSRAQITFLLLLLLPSWSPVKINRFFALF